MAIQNNIKIKKPYFENLDALRFLAAFSVFIFHFYSEIFGLYDINSSDKLVNVLISKGALGVNFFFVLSGFLITFLILWEHNTKSQFKLKHFLIRRTLRIWPLYFLIVIMGFVLFPLIFDNYSTNHSPWYYVFFLANFDEINVGLTDPINFLTAPWSVAVEEQFYLFWGILLFCLYQLKRFNLWIVLIILLLIFLIFSLANYNLDRILYYHTLSVASNIIVGSTLALVYFQKKNWLMKLKDVRTWKITLIYLLGFIMILGKNKIFLGPLAAIEQTTISIFFAFIILDQIYLNNSLFKIGKINIFNYLGKISYGLYLYHLVVMFIITQLFSSELLSLSFTIGSIVFLFLSMIGTYLLSHLSYKYFEKPFLSLKRKFY